MAGQLERWICNAEAPRSSSALTASPKFRYSPMLVNSQLVCLRPVGILNLVTFNLNYLFEAFARPH